MIKNCSFVTESKNLVPLITIGFNAKLEPAVNNRAIITEIFMSKIMKKAKKSREREPKVILFPGFFNVSDERMLCQGKYFVGVISMEWTLEQ